MRILHRASLLLICLPWFTGCVPIADEPGPDEPLSPLAMDGMYQTTGIWDLGSSLGAYGIGGLAAERMIFEILYAADIHNTGLRDQAYEEISDTLHEPLSQHVIAGLPADLQPEGGAMAELIDILESVQVTTDLFLFEDDMNPNRLSAIDVLTDISVTHQGTTASIPLRELREGTIAAEIRAEFSLYVTGPDSAEPFSHELPIRLGRLVELILEEFALVADRAALEQQAGDAIDCAVWLDIITGGADPLNLQFNGQMFTASRADLQDGCEYVQSQLRDQVFGMFELETGVYIVSSTWQLEDSDGDEILDGMTSDPDYGGYLIESPTEQNMPFSATMSASVVNQ